ncbi:MAG: type II toxin-antitoxin system RelE/ParE family toxin [Xanthomonadales bacterium]|nr:type II toxin-antitoxin system RelE/ParE family toxin [Xanthomonadales bacterium]
MVFVELPIFTRCAADIFSDEDMEALQWTFLKNPEAGDRISGGRGLRKLRAALSGQGKRGGARVIYYYWTAQSRCYLVYAYTKNRTADLSKDQLRRLADWVNAEIHDG